MFSEIFPAAHPLIGMLHAPPLPGAPRYRGDLDAVHDRVLSDARTLEEGGAHGLLLENFGDHPFHPGRVGSDTLAHMTALACAVRRETRLPLGINVLRNDGLSGLAIAHAAGASFIRVNVLCAARLTDQGVLSGIAHDLLRERSRLSAEYIRIFADIDVKHSAPLAARPLEEEIHDLIHRGGADAVIVSGAATGQPPDPDRLRQVREAAGATPVLVGSGVNARSISEYIPYADGYIVGTSLKVGQDPAGPVDATKVRNLVGVMASHS